MLTRRDSLRRRMIVAVAALLVGFVVSGAGSRADESRNSRPNFIVINIDDLGYADIEPFGSKVNRTPNLNQLAADGRRLTCFYAAPVCSPSRASLMTGCYPKRALSIPHVLFPGNSEGLAPAEITVAELLKQQGYVTGIVGKWHLGDQPEFLPTRQGFDEYFGLPYSNDMGPAEDGIKSNLGAPLPKSNGRGQPPLPLLRNETVLQRVLPDDQQAIVERYTNEAVSFLWRHRDEPFFLYLPHSAVHFPLYPGKAFAGTSSNGLYGDWVEEVDWSVGRVLQTLEQLGLDQRTLVIFTSDNGGSTRHGAINEPLRGAKGSTFEGGMRVPTIVRWTGRIPAGTATDAVCSMMDVLPTFVKLAGGAVPTDRKLDGGDVWPILSGQDDARSPHETFYFFRGLKLQAIRHGDWKLHLGNGDLFNLKSDISEANNVAKAHPEIVAKLSELAAATDADLGTDGKGPGVRPLGMAENARALIDQDGGVRPGFELPAVFAGQGILLGEPTESSILAQVRLTKSDSLSDGDLPGVAGVVRFQIEPADGSDSRSFPPVTVSATAARDFIARAAFSGLKAGSNYQLTTQIGTSADALRTGPTATFTTLPGAGQSGRLSFVVVTGMNYAKFHGDNRIDRGIHKANNNIDLPAAYALPDKHLGYPSLVSILKLRPNFFVGTGDNVYYDTPTNPRAADVTQMRRKWHEQFVQSRYRDMFAAVPTYWMIDDHDYRKDDCDNSGNYEPSPETGRNLMLEQLPYGAADDANVKTYRTHRVSRDVQIWLPENRLYRSPNAMKDGPEKSIWGTEQKEWLKQTLTASDATFKLLISPTPMVGPDDKRKFDNHTNVNGFRHEQAEFFEFLKESGVLAKNFYVICGDRHWQYHSIHPSGVEEFSSGALVDANARLGRLPGDPASTDPDGLVKQPYTQKKPSGGFLEVESAPAIADVPATLTFRFRDEHGTILHEHRKSAGQ